MFVYLNDVLYIHIFLSTLAHHRTDNAHIMLPETKSVGATDMQVSVKETVNRKEVTSKRNRPVRTNESKARSNKGKSSSSSKKSDKRKVNNTSKIPPGQSSSKEKDKSKIRDTSTADEPGKSEWGRRRQGKRNSLKRLAKKFR